MQARAVRNRPETVTVVLWAHTDGRWSDLDGAMQSLAAQTHLPSQIVIVVDHDDDLLEKVANTFGEWADGGPGIPIDVVVNTESRGLTGARNTGVSWSDGDVIAFLDDARLSNSRWVATLLQSYTDPCVAGVGGRATADWDGLEQPDWFPSEFGWVIGCSYLGLPTERAAVASLIGCNLSFRREAFVLLGGFIDRAEAEDRHSSGSAEVEFCRRLRARFSRASLVFDPDLDVFQRVQSQFRDFAHFRSRCWQDGQARALVGRRDRLPLPDGADHARRTRVLPKGILRGIGEGFRGRFDGFRRAGAIVSGLSWTAAGYARGHLARRVSEWRN